MKTAYPVTFTVDFPDRDLDRLTTAFRIIVAIPIVFVLSLLTGQSLQCDERKWLERDGRARDRRRPFVPSDCADDRVPPEVSALVVRLEPAAPALLEPS